MLCISPASARLQKKSRPIKAATRLGEEVMKNLFGFSQICYRIILQKTLEICLKSPPFDLHNVIFFLKLIFRIIIKTTGGFYEKAS